jgi:type I restriction enzyme, R subunit
MQTVRWRHFVTGSSATVARSKWPISRLRTNSTRSSKNATPRIGWGSKGSGVLREQAVPLSQLIDVVNERFGTDFNQADQLFFDQIIEAAMTDDNIRQAAAVNSNEKFQRVFKNLLEKLFVDRMDQNEEIFVRFMNDTPFQKVITTWMADEAYRKLRSDDA